MMTLSNIIDLSELLLLDSPGPSTTPVPKGTTPPDTSQSLADYEKQLVVQALERTSGNQSECPVSPHWPGCAFRYKMKSMVSVVKCGVPISHR